MQVAEYLEMVRACAERDTEEVLVRSQTMGFLTGDESQSMRDAHCQVNPGTDFYRRGTDLVPPSPCVFEFTVPPCKLGTFLIPFSWRVYCCFPWTLADSCDVADDVVNVADDLANF